MCLPKSHAISISHSRRTCLRTTASGCDAAISSSSDTRSSREGHCILSEFEAIERTLGTEKAGDLRKALHFLLRRQFVFAGDARTSTVYNVLMDGRFRSVIDGFFDSCGYRVHRDAEAQWAGI